MPGSGRNEVIFIKISVPLANAIEGALCVDAISLHGIFLPETSLHCTQAPHVFQLSVLLFYLRLTSVVVAQRVLCCLLLYAHILILWFFSRHRSWSALLGFTTQKKPGHCVEQIKEAVIVCLTG